MQFGRAVEQFLRRILLADSKKDKVYMCKIDLADGFYRVHLGPRSIAPPESFSLARLESPHKWPSLFGFPPPFCAAIETIADITNPLLLHHVHAQEHPLDAAASSRPPRCVPPPPPPEALFSVP